MLTFVEKNDIFRMIFYVSPAIEIPVKGRMDRADNLMEFEQKWGRMYVQRVDSSVRLLHFF